MSNAQTQKSTSNNRHYLTPILFITQPQAIQKELVQDFLREHLAWKNPTASPYLTWINKEKATISIEQIRQLIGELAYANYLGQRRAYILLNADLLSTAAQHAFLKSLEEPPANTQLILATAHPEELLPTIHSRCLKHHQAGWGAAQKTAAQIEELPAELLTLINQPHQVDYQSLIKLAKDYKDRDQAQKIINDLLTQFAQHQSSTQKISLKRSIEIQRQLSLTLRQLQQNLNVRLTLEGCFFQLKGLKTN